MADKDIATVRGALGFAENVERAFGPLVVDHGFRCVESTPTYVRYESEDLFLNVYHGRQSYELGVEVGWLREEGHQYRLPDVLGALLDPDCSFQTYFQASSPGAVRRCTEMLAAIVAEHYSPVLAGDPIIWQRIVTLTSQRNRASTKKVVQQPIREAANAAWEAKEFTRVLDLYRSIRSDLTPIEVKRLEYAERKLKQAARSRMT